LFREKKLKVAETGFFLPGAAIPKLGSSPELSNALFPLTVSKPYPERVVFVGGNFNHRAIERKSQTG